MRTNLNPLFENFFDSNGPKFKVNQDYYLVNYLNRYKCAALDIIQSSDTIQQAYHPFKELTQITLFNVESCSEKAINDGIIAYNTFKIKKNSILQNMNLIDKMINENDPNWKSKLISSIMTSSTLFKYI